MKTGIDIKQFRKWLLKNVGKRCKDYCFGCFACSCWRVYDDLKEIIEFEEEHETIISKDKNAILKIKK